jgi:hypothetical protein
MNQEWVVRSIMQANSLLLRDRSDGEATSRLPLIVAFAYSPTSVPASAQNGLPGLYTACDAVDVTLRGSLP